MDMLVKKERVAFPITGGLQEKVKLFVCQGVQRTHLHYQVGRLAV